MASDGEKAEERVPEGRGKVRVAWGDVIPSRWNEGCSSRLRSEAVRSVELAGGFSRPVLFFLSSSEQTDIWLPLRRLEPA